MLAILQIVMKFILIFGLAFMVICTAFVVVSVAHEDIRIKMFSGDDEKSM